ncbi:hypothetical protein Pint_11939 [Pistacia integerrima]|uniref:Uncharacterized protein n=1 Tax=Pistacia integerrima TaxID=434235 RepID=A0ACC0XHC0_9ROSI|nr:hypothetical protein Pint_11939 [Pistacia integerrima]
MLSTSIDWLTDMALELVKKHTEYAAMKLHAGEPVLSAIVRKPSAFPSGRRRKRNIWQYLIKFHKFQSFIEEIRQIKLELVRLL